MIAILLSLLLPPTHAREMCRPRFAQAIENARQKCIEFGCATDVTRTAAIFAAHPDYTASDVMAHIEASPGIRRINIGTAAIFLAELGLIDVR